MNVCRTHQVTNACITELLHLFSKVILPLPNSLPTSEGVATSMVTKLGLSYDAIDACRNIYVLFRREYADWKRAQYVRLGNLSGWGCRGCPPRY